MSRLFPQGITRLRDLPVSLFEAIKRALLFLSWEELPEDERPPRAIWLDNEALHEHFDEVRAARAEKYGLDDDYDGYDQDEKPRRSTRIRKQPIHGPVAQNELTAGIRGR